MESDTLKTEKEYEDLLDWIDSQFDKNLPVDSLEGKKLQKDLEQVRDFENKHYPIPKS